MLQYRPTGGRANTTNTTTEQTMDEAKRLFRVYTGGTGRIDALYGPAKASCRAHILSALQGERVPQRRAGWTVFRQAMFGLFGASGDCLAARERALAELAQA